jgi:hypothetical protein
MIQDRPEQPLRFDLEDAEMLLEDLMLDAKELERDAAQRADDVPMIRYRHVRLLLTAALDDVIEAKALLDMPASALVDQLPTPKESRHAR